MTSAGYWVDTMARATKMPMDSGATMNSTGIPRNFTLAGEDRYRSGRRNGSAMAATPTITTARQPASTMRPSTSWNTLEYTLQIVSPARITLTRMMALTGEWVRALTSASFSGISRSNDHANSDRIGMNVFAIIDGRLQNRKQPRMITVTNGTFTDSAARNGENGPDGVAHVLGAALA